MPSRPSAPCMKRKCRAGTWAGMFVSSSRRLNPRCIASRNSRASRPTRKQSWPRCSFWFTAMPRLPMRKRRLTRVRQSPWGFTWRRIWPICRAMSARRAIWPNRPSALASASRNSRSRCSVRKTSRNWAWGLSVRCRAVARSRPASSSWNTRALPPRPSPMCWSARD